MEAAMALLFPGASIESASKGIAAGTISFFGHLQTDQSFKVVVSNDHVLLGSATSKDKVCSPSAGTCPCCCPSNVVGIAHRGFQGAIVAGGPFVDAATAQLFFTSAVWSNRIPGLSGR